MLAFGLGCMLAGLAGAVLVQAFSWLPQTGAIPALRAFVIIVLGGLGSLPGAFIGGLILGLVEAAGAGCVPDPTRAAAYLPAYGGWCAYAMGARNEKVNVDPETFKIKDGRVFLFYNRFFTNTLTDWNEDEGRLYPAAERNWAAFKHRP